MTPKIAIVQTSARMRPAPRAAQRPERERRVGAGDEQENRGMIDHLEDGFDRAARPGVIKRRAEIDEQHRGGENGRADKKETVPAAPGGEHENRRADQSRDQTDAVADAVGEFFAKRLIPPGIMAR